MCLANLAPERGIANGTLGVMHSLKMSPKSAKKIHKSVKQQQQATPAAGSLIFLSEPPTHINISIPDLDKYVTPTADGGLEPWQRDTIAWGKANSCMPSANVFSIPAKSRKLLVATESGGKLKYHKSNVTLGFSFTVFKAQGYTFLVRSALTDKYLSSFVLLQLLPLKMRQHQAPHEIVVKDFKVDLTRDHIACLRPRTWVNDEVLHVHPNCYQIRLIYYCTFMLRFLENAIGCQHVLSTHLSS